MKIFFEILLYLFIANSVQASQWTTIYKWDEYELLYDAESITTDKQIKNSWIKIIFIKPKALYPDPLRIETFDTSVEDISFNCKNKEMKINQTIFYLNGTTLNTLQSPVRWYRPIPDSIHAYALKNICKN